MSAVYTVSVVFLFCGGFKLTNMYTPYISVLKVFCGIYTAAVNTVLTLPAQQATIKFYTRTPLGLRGKGIASSGKVVFVAACNACTCTCGCKCK